MGWHRYARGRSKLAGTCKTLFSYFYAPCTAQLGHPNDEVLSGHRLYKKGLEAYTAQIIVNSPRVIVQVLLGVSYLRLKQLEHFIKSRIDGRRWVEG